MSTFKAFETAVGDFREFQVSSSGGKKEKLYTRVSDIQRSGTRRRKEEEEEEEEETTTKKEDTFASFRRQSASSNTTEKNSSMIKTNRQIVPDTTLCPPLVNYAVLVENAIFLPWLLSTFSQVQPHSSNVLNTVIIR